MNLNDILELEGIVIRKIPKESINYWSASYKMGKNTKFKTPPSVKKEIVFCDKREKYLVKETRKNSLGGNYLLTMCNDQDSTVIFSKDTCGIGENILQAYEDFKTKNNKG